MSYEDGKPDPQCNCITCRTFKYVAGELKHQGGVHPGAVMELPVSTVLALMDSAEFAKANMLMARHALKDMAGYRNDNPIVAVMQAEFQQNPVFVLRAFLETYEERISQYMEAMHKHSFVTPNASQREEMYKNVLRLADVEEG